VSLGPLLAWGVGLAFATLLAALVATFVRMVHGPSLPDRVMALDLLSILLIAVASTFAIASGNTAVLDAALALALIAFLGTVALARYAERRGSSPFAPASRSGERRRP
jgi:multicomponent Na+:H+ antiporter subunit F